jgi:hypothetical protein
VRETVPLGVSVTVSEIEMEEDIVFVVVRDEEPELDRVRV